MSEISKIVLTAILTIAGGVIVYALGHLSVALIVAPIHRLRGLIGEIAYSLIFYASVYGNPGNVKQAIMDEAGEKLRGQGSELRARAHSIPWYRVWSLMRFVPKRTNIQKASKELIGLSNSVHGGSDGKAIQNIVTSIKICNLLGIQELPGTERKSGMKILKTFFEFISRNKKKPKKFVEEVRIRPLGELIEELRKKEQRESTEEEQH